MSMSISSVGKESNEKGSVAMQEHHLDFIPEHEEAAKVLAAAGDHSAITPEEERRVVKKIDWMLMPIVRTLIRVI